VEQEAVPAEWDGVADSGLAAGEVERDWDPANRDRDPDPDPDPVFYHIAISTP